MSSFSFWTNWCFAVEEAIWLMELRSPCLHVALAKICTRDDGIAMVPCLFQKNIDDMRLRTLYPTGHAYRNWCRGFWKWQRIFYFISQQWSETPMDSDERWKQRRNLKENRIDESNRYDYFTWLWTGEISSWMTNVTALHSCTDFRSVIGGASERAEQCWAYLRFWFTFSLILLESPFWTESTTQCARDSMWTFSCSEQFWIAARFRRWN